MGDDENLQIMRTPPAVDYQPGYVRAHHEQGHIVHYRARVDSQFRMRARGSAVATKTEKMVAILEEIIMKKASNKSVGRFGFFAISVLAMMFIGKEWGITQDSNLGLFVTILGYGLLSYQWGKVGGKPDADNSK